MVTIHLVTVWNFHTNNQSPYETCSYQINLCSIWIIFIPLTCHHLNLFHTKQILKNFHTTYQSPYEMLSYGDNSYGDGLIGFTILAQLPAGQGHGWSKCLLWVLLETPVNNYKIGIIRYWKGTVYARKGMILVPFKQGYYCQNPNPTSTQSNLT